MQLKTLLNRVHPVKGFVYGGIRQVPDDSNPNGLRIEVELDPRKGSRGLCSVCGKPGPGYDRLEVREFDFVPLWGIAVTLLYALRRIDCKRCGVKVERLPWCEPASKSPMTTAFKVFLSRWARLLSWRQTAVSFGVSWDSVYRAVADMVAYGLAHRNLSGIEAIGVDEVAYAKGHKYLTLVYQLDSGCRRLLHVSRGRSLRSLLEFFRMLKKAKIDYAGTIKYVCSDMWRAYLTVIARKLPNALHILVEGLQAMWEYRSPQHAGKFLDAWCRQAMRSRLEPIKKVARSLREHRELILNWYRARKRYNAGIVEGLNLQVKLRFRKAFGFRTVEAAEMALYHQLGHLPEPQLAHRFC